MKIIQWNISKKIHPLTAAKRYEDELFNNIRYLEPKLQVERIQRADNKYVGSTFVSWLLRYRCMDADIVHATFQTIAPVINFRKPKRFIVTVHDLNPILYPSNIRDISTKIQWMLTPKALKKADRIIAISEFTKKELMRIAGVDENKIEVVYQGVDHSKYYTMDKKTCKKKFSLNPNEKYILVVASNEEHKRMDVVKKIFGEVKKQRDDVKLIKAGYAEKLEGDSIINPGWVSEDKMPLLFNAADVYFHTSEYEGFGLPILEAMACGVPTITSNKASIPEVVESYENMIDLDSDDHIKIFAEKILQNIDKGVDNKALEQSKKFTWEKTAKDTIKVYEEIVKEVG